MRELVLQPRSGQSSTITYLLGALQPSLASRSSPSAAVGVAGLRGLNDGQVPVVAAPGGRGGGGGAGAAAAGSANAPIFTWSGSRGSTQWVQYTFPNHEEVSRVEVF